jgi:hypothetical protein
MNGRWIVVFVFASTMAVAPVASEALGASQRIKPRPKADLTKSKPVAAACGQCDNARPSKSKTQVARRGSKTAQKTACHPKGYVDPKVAKKYNAAMREMKREGIRPQVTSAWRSSAHQASLHNCSRSSRCRRANPGLYFAKPAGQSLHEAAFAVDISGVASGPRGRKRITPRGRRIVSIMQKNGFKWRYGLADPAHFEADPRKNGYPSVKAAIRKNQNSCSVKSFAGSKKKSKVRLAARAPNKTEASKPASAQSSRAKSRSHRG